MKVQWFSRNFNNFLENFKNVPNKVIKAVVESNEIRKNFIINSIINKKPKAVLLDCFKSKNILLKPKPPKIITKNWTITNKYAGFLNFENKGK